VSHMGPGVGMVHQVLSKKLFFFSSMYVYKENRITVLSMESVARGRHFLTVI